MSALVFEDVAVRLGGRAVLAGVDLAVAPGEVVGLAGCNGAGKTTLLRVATGIVRPGRGAVRIQGRPLDDWSRRALARFSTTGRRTPMVRRSRKYLVWAAAYALVFLAVAAIVSRMCMSSGFVVATAICWTRFKRMDEYSAGSDPNVA